MDEEMRSLLENGSWELVEKPEGAKPVPMKWVYKCWNSVNLVSRITMGDLGFRLRVRTCERRRACTTLRRLGKRLRV